MIEALMIPLVSYHINATRPMNETNPGLLAEFRNGLVVGAYRNSFDRTTSVLGVRRTLLSSGGVDFGGLVGACTGYRLPVCGQVSARYGWLEIGLIPKTRGGTFTLTAVLRREM